MRRIYDFFCQAPTLGSLLDPTRFNDDVIATGFPTVHEMLESVLVSEPSENTERTAMAQGFSQAARILANHYTLVVTNVPYLGRGKQVESIRDFCEKQHPNAKGDLATAFVERCLALCERGGTAGLVLPQNWLFLTTFKALRVSLLQEESLRMIARIGPGGFQASAASGALAMLLIVSHTVDDTGELVGVDVSSAPTTAEKATRLASDALISVSQTKLRQTPDARVTLFPVSDANLLNAYANVLVGLQTSDDNMFVLAFWELEVMDNRTWEYMQSAPSESAPYSGQSWMVRWEQGAGLLHALPSARPTQGRKALGRPGIVVHRMGQLLAYHFGRERFHQNVATVVPHNDSDLPSIWCFCSSADFQESVRRIDQKLNVTNATLGKVPFDIDHWRKTAMKDYPRGLPQPYSNNPTQWIFHGHPCGSVVWNDESKWTAEGPPRVDSTVLQVAVARLLGYRWPAESDTKMELASEQRKWVTSCNNLNSHTADDGIVCVESLLQTDKAVDRLQNLLAEAFGRDWSALKLRQLLATCRVANESLEDWLRNGFFAQHCNLFHQRPFVWQV